MMSERTTPRDDGERQADERAAGDPRTARESHERRTDRDDGERQQQRDAAEGDLPREGHERQRCPECDGHLETDEARGETVCGECGLVVAEGSVDRGPEWRAFDPGDRESKSRVGAPTTETMHDRGLSTSIGWQNRDASGRRLGPRQRQKMQRLRTWNERFRTRDSKDRNLKQALGEVDRMASALGLPATVRETASILYRRALDEGLLPGRSIEGVGTACLYAAARMASVPRSLDELAGVARVDRTEIARTYRYVARELGLEMEPADPVQYVGRFASSLGLSDEVETRARELLQTAREAGVHSGKSPVGLAAAAVYAAALLCNEKTTQGAVSDVADISEVTIRNRYRDLLEAHADGDGEVGVA